MAGVFLWGFDRAAAEWKKVLVNPTGYLQTVVVSSALPAGGATAANQATIIGHIDGIEAALGHCYGFDGTNWQTLLVESNVLKNLRVKLYDGATGINSSALDASSVTVTGHTGLDVFNRLYLYYTAATAHAWLTANNIPDGDGGEYYPTVGLMGFNGAVWDRLRSWGVGVLKVGRAEIDSTTIRHTAAGPVVAGAHNLYWVACSPDSPSAEWELSDDLDGLSAAVYDHFDSDKHSEHLIFDPPMKFATGIYIKRFDHMHSLVFCYV